MTTPRDAPFSVPVDVADLDDGAEPLELSAEASAAEAAALAELHGLDGIDSLSGRATLSAPGGGRLQLDGRIEARIRPVCVVTLEPFEQRISDTFRRHYTTRPGTPAAAPGAEVELSHDDAAEPDEIVGGVLDFGEALAEELALRLDPYPRKPGAGFDPPPDTDGADGGDDGAHPFAKLAALKDHKP